MDRKEQVREFFDAWRRGDADEVANWFTDDGVYHNIPMERVQGREAIRELIAAWITGLAGIDFDFRYLVADGDVVLMEREDVVPRPSGTMRLPIMGTIEFRGDEIAAWREYFDMAQMNSMLAETEGAETA